MSIHYINNVDLLKYGGSFTNLTRRNYQNSRLLVVGQRNGDPSPNLSKNDFITDKYELKYNVDTKDIIDAGIAFRGNEKLICEIDPQEDLGIQGLGNNKIIVDKFSTISLDMNYKRYDINGNELANNLRISYPNRTQQELNNLNSQGHLLEKQSLPLMIKLYCRIDTLTNPLEKRNRSKLEKYESQFTNYYQKILKKNIPKLFTSFFNKRNDTAPQHNLVRSKLKIFKLDDIELKFDEDYSERLNYDGYKVFNVRLKDFNIDYKIIVDLYPKKSEFVINVIHDNLFDYINLSYNYNLILDPEPSKRDESQNLLLFVNFKKQNNDTYLKLLNSILDKFIDIKKLESRDGGFSYYKINLFKYPTLHRHYGYDFYLYDTWCKTYMFNNNENLMNYLSDHRVEEYRSRFKLVYDDIEFLNEDGDPIKYPLIFNVYNFVQIRDEIDVPMRRIVNPRGQPVIPNYNQPRIPNNNDNNNELNVRLFRFRGM